MHWKSLNVSVFNSMLRAEAERSELKWRNILYSASERPIENCIWKTGPS